MANIPSTSTWSPDVYQIEPTDAVLGGPDGVINVQAKQLADRTAYLKQEVEAAGAVADSADTKADQALAQIASIETAAGSAQANAAEALIHKQGAQAAQALAEQASNAAEAAQAQAGDNAGFAAQAAQTATLKASEAQSAATAALAALAPTVEAKDSAVAARDAAQAAQAGAEAAMDLADDIRTEVRNWYYGPLAADPTLRPDGTAIQVGDEYQNTTAHVRKVYANGAWRDVSAAALAAAGGSGSVGYQPAGPGTVATTVENKLREDKSLSDFLGSDDDARFANAKANGTKWLRIPQGDHTITGWSIAESDSLVGLIFDPGARLLVTAASGRIGLDIQKNWFKIIGECWIESTGTAADGLATVGVRQGHPTLGGKAYFEADRIRYANFSSRGFVSYQPVYIGIGSIVGSGAAGSPMYGVSIERATISGAGTIPGTTVQIGRSYISGATRGINLDGTGWVELDMPVLEYCGSSSTIDGALHMLAVSQCVIKNIYGEQNYRNIVRVDSTPVFIGGSMFAAAAPDSVSYVGTAFDQRGTVQLRNNTINARKIGPDVNDNADLTIGTNLIVPSAGGSVKFGNTTTEALNGTATASTWTTIKSFPASEMSGAAQGRAAYRYVVYGGYSDLTTGFDSGTVLNGVARSDTGTLPAWLRMSGNDLQINLASSSYGLVWKLVLTRTFPGSV